MEIRRAERLDISLLTDNRTEFVQLIRNIDDIQSFKDNTRLYLEEHIDDGSIISYIAVEDDTILSSCILCVYKTLPVPSNASGKTGLLLNVYTLKDYRRKGLATLVLNKLIEAARQQGVGKILLDYTEDGYELYKKLGFKELDRDMVLKL